MSSFIHRRGHRRRVSLRCTGDARISFAVKLLDGVVLDKTISDQVRLHHTIFLDQFVMAPIARTDGVLPIQDRWCAPDPDSHDAILQRQ